MVLPSDNLVFDFQQFVLVFEFQQFEQQFQQLVFEFNINNIVEHNNYGVLHNNHGILHYDHVSARVLPGGYEGFHGRRGVQEHRGRCCRRRGGLVRR
jgi:hypothetical protein